LHKKTTGSENPVVRENTKTCRRFHRLRKQIMPVSFRIKHRIHGSSPFAFWLKKTPCRQMDKAQQNYPMQILGSFVSLPASLDRFKGHLIEF
jgi:hypothetical protein